MIRDHLAPVKHKVLILSGKGGVGKSTVCGQVAYALSAMFEAENKQIGVLDIDICGPSLPQVFGVQGQQVTVYNLTNILKPILLLLFVFLDSSKWIWMVTYCSY